MLYLALLHKYVDIVSIERFEAEHAALSIFEYLLEEQEGQFL